MNSRLSGKGSSTDAPEEMHNKVHMYANEKWINCQMKEGKNLVDIGTPVGPHPDSGTPMGPSPCYVMEHEQVSKHIGRRTAGGQYSTDHQPDWDLKGQ